MGGKLRVTAILLAAIAAGYVGGLMSQTKTSAQSAGTTSPTYEVLRAKRFELVDAAGKMRAVLGIMDSGNGRLQMFDSSGSVVGKALIVRDEGSPKSASVSLQASNVRWERTSSGLLSIVGQVTNTTSQKLQFVSVDINLYNASGAQVGTALDNVANLEPGKTWIFRAPALEETATTFKVMNVTAH